MNLSTEDAVLNWLDFTYQPPCDVRGCDDAAASNTKYEVHPECNSHTRWYALCSAHTERSVEGKTVCKRCGDALLVSTVLFF